jgi:hypothetical protein
MRSSFTRKIEKAKKYAQEPDRVTLLEFSANFRGGHDLHTVSYTEGKWHCSCYLFSQWGTCSHIMALQQMLSTMLPKEALTSPFATEFEQH